MENINLAEHIKSKEIRLVLLSEIQLNPKNRNVHPKEQIDRLALIIKYQGFREPCIISNRSGLLIAGEGRYLAAKKIGLKSIPVIFQDFDSDEQEASFGVSTNAIASWAELDFAAINLDLPDLGPDFDIDLLGIDGFELEPADKFFGDEDAVPEVKAETNIKPGDMFSLGSHRLLCGDCTVKENVERLMGGEKADMVFTSPPYNLGKFEVSGPKATNPNRKEKYLTVTDDLSPEQYEEFLFQVVDIYLNHSDTVMINVGMMDGNKRPILRMIFRHLDRFKETLYWKKSTSTPHIQPGIVTSLVEPIFCFGNHPSRQFKHANFKWNCNNVIEGSNASGNEFADIHAATFPVYFPEWAITNFSQGSIVDPFLGSGSTLIACEKTGRRCFGMEIDPGYCQVILDRWEKFTGKKAVFLENLTNQEVSLTPKEL